MINNRDWFALNEQKKYTELQNRIADVDAVHVAINCSDTHCVSVMQDLQRVAMAALAECSRLEKLYQATDKGCEALGLPPA